jgi:hypothetical protein
VALKTGLKRKWRASGAACSGAHVLQAFVIRYSAQLALFSSPPLFSLSLDGLP